MKRKAFALVTFIVLLFFIIQGNAFALVESANAANGTSKKVLVKMKENGKGPEAKHGNKIKKQKKIKDNIYLLDVSEQALSDFREDPEIEFIEDDATVEKMGEVVPWNVEQIGSKLMQEEKQLNGSGVKVAVFDTGIDLSNPDLSVASGASFVEGNSSFADDNGHGTGVAGVLAALKNNQGLIGSAPGVQLYSVKILDQNGVGTYSNIIQGLQWAMENDMDIIVMSFGSPSYSKILKDTMHEAVEKDILIVAAAGNNSGGILYPAAYGDVISVGATDQMGKKAPFSNSGEELDLVAPGVNIETLSNGGGLVKMNGTSLAAPHVAGIAAQIWSAKRDLTVQQMKNLLYMSATPLGEKDDYGWGLARTDKAYFAINNNLDILVDTSSEKEPTQDVGLDGVVLAQADKTGDNQYINAGESVTVGIKFSEYHQYCHVFIFNSSGDLVDHDFYGSVYAGQWNYYTWDTSTSTPGGNYTIQFDVGNGWLTEFTVHVSGYTPPQPTDDYGNDIYNAASISVGGSRSGRINYNADEDFFRFTTSQSGSYTIQTTGSSDTYGYLYDSYGNPLQSNDDSGAGTNFLITRTLEANRTYYVSVNYYGHSGTGSYTLSVSYTPIVDDHGNSRSTGTVISIGSPVAGRIDYEEDWDYFKFTPTVTGRYKVETTGSMQLQGFLFGPDGIITNDTNGGNISIIADLQAGSTYDFEVLSTLSTATGNYTVLVSLQQAALSITSGPSHSDVGSNTATITWTTNLAATSVVEYGTTSLNHVESISTGTRTSHSIDLSGLNPSTTYQYRVRSVANGATVTSDIKSFQTQSTIPSGRVPERDDSTVDDGSMHADPVDTATGTHLLERQMLAVNGAMPINFKLAYNSLLLNEGPLGKGWGHNYEIRLEQLADGNIKIHWTANKRNIFNPAGNNIYTSTSSATRNDKLVKNSDNTFTLTRKDQTVYKFDANGRFLQYGNGLGPVLDLQYDASGRVNKVTEPISGKYLSFKYNASNLLERVADNAGRQVAFAYNAGRCLTGITDANNKTTVYTYDNDGRILTGIDGDNVRIFSNVYDGQGRVATQDDNISTNQLTAFTYDEITEPGKVITTVHERNGKTKVLTHNSNMQLLKLVDELGYTTTYTYDDKGNKLTETNAKNQTTAFTYDDRGNLLTITDPANRVTTMTYDSRNNLLTLENSAGKKYTYTYDTNNNLLTVTDPLSKTTTYSYENGLLKTKRTPRGGTSSYTYENGLVKTVTNPEGYTVTNGYDAAGRLTTIIDGAGKTTTLQYDGEGNVRSVIDPLGNTVSFTYDSRGNKLAETDAKGNTTSYAYNGNGKLEQITNALNQTIKYEYDAEDRLVKVFDARNNATAFTVDALGRATGVTNALGKSTITEYDVLGNVTLQKDAYNRPILSISYDSSNNPETLTDAIGNTITRQYDSLNRVVGVVDALGRSTSYNYDDLNRLVSAVNALGGQSSQGFDNDGNIDSISDTNGNSISYTYDLMGRVLSQTTSAGKTITYQYDQNRNLLEQSTNGREQVTSYQYDAAGRMLSFTDPNGTVSFTYDANGNVLTVRDSSGTIEYTYDVLNRVSSYTDVYGNSIGYTYDAAGNLTTLTYPGNKAVQYNYDAVDRLTSVTDWSGRITGYTYDDNGRLQTTTRPDGSVETRIYDAAGRLTQVRDVKADDTVINQFDYTYDEVNNITEEKGTVIADTKLNLPPSGEQAFRADNRLATFNGQPVEYDADGNMISGPLKGQMTAYEYDARNRLISVGDASYTYDAANNRVAKNENGTITRYVIDPNASLSQVLMETDEKGTVKAYYIYGIGLVGKVEAMANKYYNYHFDSRGSTVALTDETGEVTDRYSYGPYGEIVQRIGETENSFQYVGQYGVMTDNNGLYYMRARYYNPEIKSFINEDTFIGSNLSELNRFTYVSGNPLRRIDPTGHWNEEVHYHDTMGWALEVGFTFEDAQRIAEGCLSVDYDYATEPLVQGDQSWHFNRSFVDNNPDSTDTRIVHAEQQMEIVKTAILEGLPKEVWLYELGKGLHPLQDIYAHMDAGWNISGRIETPHANPAYHLNYDSTLWDYVDGSWYLRDNKYLNTRWLMSEDITKEYLQEIK